MAAFSYQYHPFLVDSVAFMLNINTGPPPPPPSQFHLHQETSFNVTNQDQDTNCVDQSSKITISDNEPSVTKNHSPQSSMVVDKLETGEQVTQKVTPMQKKRRITRNGLSPSSSNPQSKEIAAEGRNKKQKKSNGGGVKEEDKKKDERKCPEEPPTGYIHVRARRGQATDSHSLAERVRREKISERMKKLQQLVPGCDKVTGKALMLDEIINYVQSLQNQVEFLSMKLSSVNPMFYDLATDLDTLSPLSSVSLNCQNKLNSLASPSPLSSVSHSHCNSPNQATTFADTTTIFQTASDYYLDNSASFFLQGQTQRSNDVSEDTGSQFWDAEDQRQKFLHSYGFSNNLCSFH